MVLLASLGYIINIAIPNNGRIGGDALVPASHNIPHDRYYGHFTQNGTTFAIDDAYDVVVNYTALELKWDKEWEDSFTYPNKTYAVLKVTTDAVFNAERCYPIYDVWYDDNKTLKHIRLPADIRWKADGRNTIKYHLLDTCIIPNESKLVLTEVYSNIYDVDKSGNPYYQKFKWELHVTPEMLGYDDYVREAMQYV